MLLEKIKKPMKVKIGVYSAGLKTYWEQFDELKACLAEYNKFITHKLSAYGEVHNFGFVDTEEIARDAGEYFNKNNVDIIFAHAATYFTSSCVISIHQINSAPVIFLNLQPTAEMDYYNTGTDRWLAQCVGCGIPEVANAFNRCNIKFRVVNGLLGLNYTPKFAIANENTENRLEAIKAWNEIEEWCMAASVKITLQNANFGFLGNYYNGMLDMYSDLTMLQAQTKINVKIFEMSDLNFYLKNITDNEINSKLTQIREFFEISENSSSDLIAKKPTLEQLKWAAKVAVSQEYLVRGHNLDSISYYYHGKEDEFEKIQSGFIVGFSLLNAQGIPCAGEGDIKTALAMKIADICGRGGSFCEIIASDFNRNTIIMGHDGPFHFAISEERPILRGLGLYHGKRGSGISVEAKVAEGPVTTLGVTQSLDGKLKLNISEGWAINAPTLLNGNTSTHIKFNINPVEYMDKWFAEFPTHHFALTKGHNISQFKKIADILNIPYAIF